MLFCCSVSFFPCMLCWLCPLVNVSFPPDLKEKYKVFQQSLDGKVILTKQSIFTLPSKTKLNSTLESFKVISSWQLFSEYGTCGTVPENFLSETGQSLRLFLVPLQVLGQQVTERAQCLLLEHQPLWLERTLSDGGLELATSTQLKLKRKIMDEGFTNGLIRSWSEEIKRLHWLTFLHTFYCFCSLMIYSRINFVCTL